ERSALRVPHQQLRPPRVDDRAALQMSMASRAVLQMDQAAFTYQILLRHERQRGEDSSVDCDQRLCARGHREEGTRGPTELDRNLANSQPGVVRENPYFSGFERSKRAKPRPRTT